MTYDQTRTGLHRPTRGVRTTEQGWWADLAGFALALPDHAFFSHLTAAHILDLPLPAIDPRPFHVTVPPDKSRGSRDGIAWHARPLTGDRTRSRGFPITTALRTWRDLGEMLGVPDLVAAADVMLRRRHCTMQELQATAGIRHARKLSIAADLAHAGSRSPRESLFRVAMVEAKLPRPELNKDILDRGAWLGCGDFVWEGYRLIVDYDGQDHGDSDQRHQDAATRNAYRLHGWQHLVITKHMTRNMDYAVGFVREGLMQAGWVA